VKHVVLIAGTRPECLKLAPVWRALGEAETPRLFLAVQQHIGLLEQHLDEAQIKPDLTMPVSRDGPGNLNQLLSRAIEAADQGLRRLDLDHGIGCVLVQGDTATAFAGAIAAFHLELPVGHVEAGLRSWRNDSPFPEEGYRRMISQIATAHYAPTKAALDNLCASTDTRGYYTGNTSVDQLLHDLPLSKITYASDKPIILVTLHRREGLERIPAACDALAGLAGDFQIYWPAHPNPLVQRKIHACGQEMLPPLLHAEFCQLLASSAAVVTDSGGVIEEAATLGISTFILRDATERQEAIDAGIAELVPEGELSTLVDRVRSTVHERQKAPVSSAPPGYSGPAPVLVQGVRILPIFGDGQAGERIAELARELVK